MIQKLFAAMFAFSLSSIALGQVVAKVGGNEITLKEFKEKYSEVKRGTFNAPPPEIFLEDLVRFEMGVQEAEAKKLQNDPEVKERFRKELYKILLERELTKNVDSIKITEAEMREYYKKNPELRSSHILIEVRPDATPEQKAAARKRAEEILADVKKSKRPFEEQVRIYSDDALSKQNGGDIGYQNRITIAPTYYDLLLKLKPDEIGGPVETMYGFHLVKLTGRRTFQDANRRQIRALVFDEKRKDIFDAYFKKLSSRYKVTRDEKLIKSLK